MDGADNNVKPKSQEGISNTVFAVVFCTVIIVVILAAGFVVIQDWNAGNQAYRNSALKNQRDGYRTACEDNYKRFTILQKYVEQQGLKPSPDLMVAVNCVQPEPPEAEMK